MPELPYRVLRPWLFRLDAEEAHNRVLRTVGFVARHPHLLSVVERMARPRTRARLSSEVFGLRFENPIGLAAGLDKNGVAIDYWAALGFGFVEVGTVTKGEGQPGNEAPRLARLIPDEAILNRMGFNNRGADALAEKLRQRRSRIPVGANLGKAKLTPLEDAPEDYALALRPVWRHVDYVTVNVSSPNTPGLRSLQAIDSLRPLLLRVQEENRAQANAQGLGARPILLKVAPDLADEDLDRIADLALELALDGLIATNTTIRAEGLRSPLPFEGGVSGRPLKARALACTKRLYRRTEGAIPIVGVGGIASAEDAYERLRAGASLIQVYTAFIYEGPLLVRRLAEGLDRLLGEARVASLSEIVGADARR